MKGWYKEPFRHKLASKGVRTTTSKGQRKSTRFGRPSRIRLEEMMDSYLQDFIEDEDIVESVNYEILTMKKYGVEKWEHILIDIWLKDADMASSINYEWTNGEIGGKITFPEIDEEDYEEFKEFAESKFAELEGGKGIWVRKDNPQLDEPVPEEGKVRPHADIMDNSDFSAGDIKSFEERLFQLLGKIEEIYEGVESYD